MYFENIISLNSSVNLILLSPFWSLVCVVALIVLAAILVLKLSDLRAIKHQFEDYKTHEPKHLLRLKSELEALETKNNALNKKLKELKKEGDNKNLEMTKLEETIEDLEAKIRRLTNRKKEVPEDIVVEYYTDRKSKK